MAPEHQGQQQATAVAAGTAGRQQQQLAKQQTACLAKPRGGYTVTDNQLGGMLEPEKTGGMKLAKEWIQYSVITSASDMK